MTIFQIMLLLCTQGTGKMSNLDTQCRTRVSNCLASTPKAASPHVQCVSTESDYQSGKKNAYVQYYKLLKKVYMQ